MFLAGAGLAVREAAKSHQEAVLVEREAASGRRVVTTAFIVIFLAEWGDLTQILTANLAAHYHSPLSVGVGAVLALWAVAALAVIGGQSVLRFVNLRTVRVVTAVVLVGVGRPRRLAGASLGHVRPDAAFADATRSADGSTARTDGHCQTHLSTATGQASSASNQLAVAVRAVSDRPPAWLRRPGPGGARAEPRRAARSRTQPIRRQMNCCGRRTVSSAGDRGDGPGPIQQCSLGGGGDPVIGEVLRGQGGAVALGGPARSMQHGLAGRTPAGHGLGDPLALQRVDQAGGVAHEQHPSRGRGGPDHAHLEPAPEARVTGLPDSDNGPVSVRSPSARQCSRKAGRARTAVAPAWRSERVPTPRPTLAQPVRAGKDPPVAGERLPRCGLPQDDGREIDHLG